MVGKPVVVIGLVVKMIYYIAMLDDAWIVYNSKEEGQKNSSFFRKYRKC